MAEMQQKLYRTNWLSILPNIFILASEKKAFQNSSVDKCSLWKFVPYERSQLAKHSTICVILTFVI